MLYVQFNALVAPRLCSLDTVIVVSFTINLHKHSTFTEWNMCVVCKGFSRVWLDIKVLLQFTSLLYSPKKTVACYIKIHSYININSETTTISKNNKQPKR